MALPEFLGQVCPNVFKLGLPPLMHLSLGKKILPFVLRKFLSILWHFQNFWATYVLMYLSLGQVCPNVFKLGLPPLMHLSLEKKFYLLFLENFSLSYGTSRIFGPGMS